jgi:hypothetical protein
VAGETSIIVRNRAGDLASWDRFSRQLQIIRLLGQEAFIHHDGEEIPVRKIGGIVLQVMASDPDIKAFLLEKMDASFHMLTGVLTINHLTRNKTKGRKTRQRRLVERSLPQKLEDLRAMLRRKKLAQR